MSDMTAIAGNEQPGGATMAGMAHATGPSHARTRPPGAPQHWPLLLIAAPAAVAIWSGWVGLGGLCGFGLVQPFPGIVRWHLDTAITLPVGIESYGAYALYVWLGGKGSDRTRAFARSSAIGAGVLGCLGQIAFHLMAAAHWTRAPWYVVMLVACLPVITLFFAATLTHLMRADHRDAEEARTARAEASVKAAERKAARMAQAPPPEPGSRPAPARKTAAPARQKPKTAAPEPDETIDLDAEAQILSMFHAGELDTVAGILQLVANGRKPSQAGPLVGKSDSYGRKVVRQAEELAKAAPRGSEE